MKIQTDIGFKKYEADLSTPIDISIPLSHGRSPIAFGAPQYEAIPYQEGDFIGAIEEGSPVNFYNLKINPHGNCTHTETVNHIDKRGLSILEVMHKQHFVAQLISITPQTLTDGDRIINESCFEFNNRDFTDIEALIIRTRPNRTTQKYKNYTNTNPPYVSHKFIERINKTSVKHVLIDLPSVDKEVDGGRLLAHNAYWNTSGGIVLDKTITEMIFVDNKVKDGLYLLNIQVLPLLLDVSPSRPVIYSLKEI